MALEHPRLLAASLTVALVGTSCSTPTDNSGELSGDNTSSESSQPGGMSMTGEPISNQDPQGNTIARQRDLALVEWKLENARTLRTRG